METIDKLRTRVREILLNEFSGVEPTKDGGFTLRHD